MDVENQIHFLDANDASLLVNSISDLKHKAIVLLMLDAGLRVSEVISLQFGNFNFKDKILNVRSLKKRKKSKDFANRQIPLSQRLFLCLAEYSKEFKQFDSLTYLFPSPENHRHHITRQSVGVFLRRLNFSKLNIKHLHPHALRHSFATSLVASGSDMVEIANLLGHDKLDTTRIYTHIPKDKLQKSIIKSASLRGEKQSFFMKMFGFLFAKQPPTVYVPSQNITPVVGRNSELQHISGLLEKDVNVIITGKYGTGKRLILDSIQAKDKKILTIDDTSSIKKSLVYMLLYLYKNDKEQVASLMFGNFDETKIETRLSRQSVPYLCDAIKSVVHPKEYILKIRQFDDVTKQSLKVIDQLKETFIIFTCATEISVSKAPFFGNFEKIELKNLNRPQSFELVHKLSSDMQIENYEVYRDHIWNQTDGNPRAIIDMIGRYKREPRLLVENIRSITHSGVVREIDCSYALVLLIASLAVMRYMTGELDNPALRFIGGMAMILLLLTRAFVSKTKRSAL